MNHRSGESVAEAFVPPSIGVWPKEIMDRLGPLDIDLKATTVEELKSLYPEMDNQIHVIVEQYRTEKLIELLDGVNEPLFMDAIKELITLVPLSKMENFLDRCPRGQVLFDEYNSFIKGLIKQGIADKQVVTQPVQKFLDHLMEKFAN